MNDNLRYISLQYIKGNNYEEITCFNYEVIREILDNDDNFKDISTYTLNELKDAISDDKCYIGESFLNDLVNYYNFKDIRKKIEHAKRVINDYKENLSNKKISDSDSKEKKTKRAELSEYIGTLKNGLKDQKYSNDDFLSVLIDIRSAFDKLKDMVNNYIFDTNITNILLDNIPSKDSLNYDSENPMKAIIKKIKEEKDKIPTNLQSIKNEIIKGMNKIIISNKGTKYDFLNLLITLNKLLKYEQKQEVLQGKTDVKKVDDLLALLKTYTKICNRNIGKYDKIFQYNDISNIDEAFMIESYSKFLKKLNKLKENLESKDKDKLERALTNSLEKLFNLYGINDYEKIINGEEGKKEETPDMKYFRNQILNY